MSSFSSYRRKVQRAKTGDPSRKRIEALWNDVRWSKELTPPQRQVLLNEVHEVMRWMKLLPKFDEAAQRELDRVWEARWVHEILDNDRHRRWRLEDLQKVSRANRSRSEDIRLVMATEKYRGSAYRWKIPLDWHFPPRPRRLAVAAEVQ